MRKFILGLVASAAIATGILAAAPANAAATKTATPAPISGTDPTMADAIPSVWEHNAYWEDSSAKYAQSVTVNDSFTITNSVIKVDAYEGAWLTSITFAKKVPLAGADASKKPSLGGAITHTTPYGTTTTTWSVPTVNANDVPWTLVDNGTDTRNVVLDPYSAAADAIYAQQVDHVYYKGGQNAAFWFPAF